MNLLACTVFVVQFHAKNFSHVIQYFVIISKLISVCIHRDTAVFFQAVNDLSDRKAVAKFCLQQPDQNKGGKAGDKVCVYVLICSYINRP